MKRKETCCRSQGAFLYIVLFTNRDVGLGDFGVAAPLLSGGGGCSAFVL